MAKTSKIVKSKREPKYEVQRRNRCSLCGRPAANTCALCGRTVCDVCSDPVTKVCRACAGKMGVGSK